VNSLQAAKGIAGPATTQQQTSSLPFISFAPSAKSSLRPFISFQFVRLSALVQT